MRKFCRARHWHQMHDEPNLPNYGDPGRGARLQEAHGHCHRTDGDAGKPDVHMRDEWVAETAEHGQPSADFEHTVAGHRKRPLE